MLSGNMCSSLGKFHQHILGLFDKLCNSAAEVQLQLIYAVIEGSLQCSKA